MKTDEVMTLGRSGHLGMRAETIPVPRQLLWDMADELRARMPAGKKLERFTREVRSAVDAADERTKAERDSQILAALDEIRESLRYWHPSPKRREEQLQEIQELATQALGIGKSRSFAHHNIPGPEDSAGV